MSERMRRNIPASEAPMATTAVMAPRRLSPRSISRRPIGTSTSDTSSFTEAHSTTATQYSLHRRSNMANRASGRKSPRNESGWKFSRFVPFTAGLSNHVEPMTTGITCPPRRRRARK
ncbi:MAG: hypothetical protein RLZZ93_1317 [Actinomycetota bacterium]